MPNPMDHQATPSADSRPSSSTPGEELHAKELQFARQSRLRVPGSDVEAMRLSTSSISAASIKSHESMDVIGTHPLGSLQVLEHGETTPQPDNNEDDDSLPPLDPPESPQNSDVALEEPLSRRTSNPSSARDLPTHGMGGGDVVLIMNLPEVFIVGFDSVSFTARHFGGVRDLPPGPHFFWVSHPDGASARSGFWVYSTDTDNVHVLEWDRFYEGLVESSRAEARIQAEKMETYHAKLVPYHNPAAVGVRGESAGDVLPPGPHIDAELSTTENISNNSKLRMWRQLTQNINQQVLNHVAGQSETTWHVHTADRVKGAILLAAEMELERRFSNPHLQAKELKFSFSQHAKTYSTADFGPDRSLAARDPTSYIINILKNPDQGLTENDIVGELQFAYITGMHLGNDSCIQQWWHMVLKLILKAHALIEERPTLAAALLQTIASQLVYGYDWLDGSVLDYADVNSRDLRLELTIYNRRLQETLALLDNNATTDVLAVGNSFARLEAAVASLGWDIRSDYLRSGKVVLEDGEEVELELTDLEAEDERGEWAPEVVELDENGRERGLVHW